MTNPGEFIGESAVLVRIALALVFTGIALVTTMPAISFAASKTNQIQFSYVPPEEPGLLEVSNWVMERQPLEKLQEFLSPIRLPRTLKFSLTGCEGEDDAFYWKDKVTICYELVERLYANMPAERTPAGIEPIDTAIGPFFDMALHEFAHGLFELLNIPILGRERTLGVIVADNLYSGKSLAIV